MDMPLTSPPATRGREAEPDRLSSVVFLGGLRHPFLPLPRPTKLYCRSLVHRRVFRGGSSSHGGAPVVFRQRAHWLAGGLLNQVQ